MVSKGLARALIEVLKDVAIYLNNKEVSQINSILNKAIERAEKEKTGGKNE